ncbi:MAG: TonB-dependent siderophore receptor [Puniceicoccaceae bacterium]
MKRIQNKQRRLLAFGIAGMGLGLMQFTLEGQGDENIIELSPFEVLSSEQEGYRATNSLSATRINTAVRDLPFNLEVVTEAFIDDIAAFDLQESLKYQSGVVTSGDTGTRIRGFNSLWNQRNGFRRYDYGDAVSIQRVEVVKGPAAVLYGITAPGGITNYITKRPIEGNHVELKQYVGENSFFRTELDANVGSKDAIRFRILGAFQENDSYLSNVSWNVDYVNPVMAWNISEKTQVIIEAEYLDRTRTKDRGRLYDRSKLASPQNGWFDDIYDSVGHGTAFLSNRDEWQNNRVDTYSATIEHKFADNFVARFNAYFIRRFDNEQSTSRRGWNTQVSAVKDRDGNFILDSAGNKVPGIQRHWAKDSSRNRWQSYQLDLLYSVEGDNSRHQFLAGAYYSFDNHFRILFEDRDFLKIDDPSNPGTAPAGYRGSPVVDKSGTPIGWLGSARKLRWVTIGDPNMALGLDDPNYDPVSWKFPWLEYQDDIINYAVYTNYLGTFMNERLNIMAGIRYDKNDYERASYGAVGAQTPTENSHVSPQLGAIYRLTDELSVYGLTSSSMNPANGAANSFEESLDPETGVQYEVGLKGEFLDNRLSATLGYFQVTEQDKIITDPDLPNAGGGFGDRMNAGEVESIGFDFNLYGNLTPTWSFVFNAAYVDQEITSDPNPAAVGQKINTFQGAGLNWSLWNNVAIRDGDFNGLSFGLGVVHIGDWTGTDSMEYGDVYTVDAALRYRFMVGEDYEIQTAINIKNLTDEKDLGGPWIAPREVYLSAGLRF